MRQKQKSVAQMVKLVDFSHTKTPPSELVAKEQWRYVVGTAHTPLLELSLSETNDVLRNDQNLALRLNLDGPEVSIRQAPANTSLDTFVELNLCRENAVLDYVVNFSKEDRLTAVWLPLQELVIKFKVKDNHHECWNEDTRTKLKSLYTLAGADRLLVSSVTITIHKVSLAPFDLQQSLLQAFRTRRSQPPDPQPLVATKDPFVDLWVEGQQILASRPMKEVLSRASHYKESTVYAGVQSQREVMLEPQPGPPGSPKLPSNGEDLEQKQTDSGGEIPSPPEIRTHATSRPSLILSPHLSSIQSSPRNASTRPHCFSCKIFFTSHHDLFEHLESQHNFQHKCPTCGHLSATQELHYIHQTDSHDSFRTKTFKCYFCQEHRQSRTTLFRHMEKKHGYKHKCKVCGMCFRVRENLYIHWGEAHNASYNAIDTQEAFTKALTAVQPTAHQIKVTKTWSTGQLAGNPVPALSEPSTMIPLTDKQADDVARRRRPPEDHIRVEKVEDDLIASKENVEPMKSLQTQGKVGEMIRRHGLEGLLF